MVYWDICKYLFFSVKVTISSSNLVIVALSSLICFKYCYELSWRSTDWGIGLGIYSLWIGWGTGSLLSSLWIGRGIGSLLSYLWIGWGTGYLLYYRLIGWGIGSLLYSLWMLIGGWVCLLSGVGSGLGEGLGVIWGVTLKLGLNWCWGWGLNLGGWGT